MLLSDFIQFLELIIVNKISPSIMTLSNIIYLLFIGFFGIFLSLLLCNITIT